VAGVGLIMENENEGMSAAQALNTIISILNNLDHDARKRVIETVSTFFQIEGKIPSRDLEAPDHAAVSGRPSRPSFSADTSLSPKEFLLEKQPRTDVERIACLAFYLTHFGDMPHFKSLDLAKLNTEAAQPKFSNIAYATANAASMGYLADAVHKLRVHVRRGASHLRNQIRPPAFYSWRRGFKPYPHPLHSRGHGRH
jgi:hypothetical protein